VNGTEAADGPSLVLEKVTYRYPGEARAVLNKISLTIAPGEIVCVLGPSGCGKTTLLKVAASFLLPLTGTVTFGGAVVAGPDPDRIVVFQEQDQLFPWKTALGNVIFPLRHAGRHRGSPDQTERSFRERAMAALAEVELRDDADRYPRQLSGGMRQRVALARAFVMEPAVLLLDEPFAAVDAPTRERLGLLLQRLQRTHNPGVLFVTHDMDEALRLGDRLVVLNRKGTVCLHEEAWPDPSALRSRIRAAMEL
jgi:NitT/TauT family transport system ATP-binding protein